MTTYGLDVEQRMVWAVWPVGVGQHAATVGALPASADRAVGEQLCEALTGLSEALWDTYTRPATAADADDEQERWRREQQRDGFVEVLEAIAEPRMPDERSLLLVSYNPVVESAHGLGRVLRQVGDPALTGAVLAEARAEIEAVAAAERGELSERAVQAVVLDRVDASPVQVQAADRLLAEHPLGTPRLLTTVDPAAACVAAAHWLAAAADVAADAAGIAPSEVFGYADDIEAVSVEVPGMVVEAILGEDAAPREVVLELLADAAAVRQGRHPDPGGLPDLVDAAREQVARLPAGQRDEVLAGLLARVTPLDPLRPARDLLEHLLDGIRGCLLVYREEGVSQATEDLDDADEDDYDRIGAKVEGEFAAAVRQRAHQDRARLT